jgi:hypothetical protein
MSRVRGHALVRFDKLARCLLALELPDAVFNLLKEGIKLENGAHQSILAWFKFCCQ